MKSETDIWLGIGIELGIGMLAQPAKNNAKKAIKTRACASRFLLRIVNAVLRHEFLDIFEVLQDEPRLAQPERERIFIILIPL